MSKEMALAKLEQEKVEKDKEALREIVRLWVLYDESVAERVLQADKSIAGGFRSALERARKLARGNYYEPTWEEMTGWLMEYYGESEPQRVIEGGFAYFAALVRAGQFRPYDAGAAEDIRRRAEAVAGAAVSQPVEAEGRRSRRRSMDMEALF